MVGFIFKDPDFVIHKHWFYVRWDPNYYLRIPLDTVVMFGFRKFEGKCKGKKIKNKSWRNEKVKKNKKNKLKIDKLLFCYFKLILFILIHQYID